MVVNEGEFFNKAVGAKTRQVAYGCAPTVKADLVAALKSAGINASGFAAKANIEPEDESRATEVVKATVND